MARYVTILIRFYMAESGKIPYRESFAECYGLPVTRRRNGPRQGQAYGWKTIIFCIQINKLKVN